LPAACLAQLLLICSVARNLSSCLCLGSLAGKEAGVKLFSSHGAEPASLPRWLRFIRASDTAAISCLACSFFASLLAGSLFLLSRRSQREICILFPPGFPRCCRDELQATTIKAGFLQAGWARRIPAGKCPHIFSTACLPAGLISAENPTVSFHT